MNSMPYVYNEIKPSVLLSLSYNDCYFGYLCRSGRYLYKSDMKRTCCPLYTIR